MRHQIEDSLTVTNDCNISKIVDDYTPIVEAAINAYRDILGNSILSIRIMGSVPRGEAVRYQSDIDFVAIVAEFPEKSELTELDERSKKLCQKYSIVSKVDLEIEKSDDIHPSREFIFYTDSICIWGNDSYDKQFVKIKNTVLAERITPKIDSILTGYNDAVIRATEPGVVWQYSRWTGKDLLKCFRKHLILEHMIYEKSAEMIHNRLVHFYPQEKETFDLLLSIYKNPIDRRETILKAIQLSSNTKNRMAD